MVRRAYCIECRKLHRRDPATWTNRSCCRCGGEVRFSGGPIPRETVTISVKVLPDVRALLGPDPVATLHRVLVEHVDRLHRRALRRGRISFCATLELEPPAPITGHKPWGRRQLKLWNEEEISPDAGELEPSDH
jgi:hypothetical protein